MTQRPVGRSSDVEIVDALQSRFLDAFLPLARPAVEHAVDVPGVVEELRSQLLKHKVSAPASLCLQRRCVTLSKAERCSWFVP